MKIEEEWKRAIQKYRTESVVNERDMGIVYQFHRKFCALNQALEPNSIVTSYTFKLHRERIYRNDVVFRDSNRM